MTEQYCAICNKLITPPTGDLYGLYLCPTCKVEAQQAVHDKIWGTNTQEGK